METGLSEIRARDASRGTPQTRDAADPLNLCPARLRPRYRARADRAQAGRYRDAVALKCIDCCGWQYAEAKRCEITSCALWEFRPRSRPRAARPDHDSKDPF